MSPASPDEDHFFGLRASDEVRFRHCPLPVYLENIMLVFVSVEITPPSVTFFGLFIFLIYREP